MDTERRESDVHGFYEQEAAGYDEERWQTPAGAETSRVQWEIAHTMLERAPRGLFLELGVGTGRFAATLTSRERPCVALDISRAMLGKTAARAAAEGTRPFLRPVQASGLRLPFANSSLGACLSLNVFSHLPDAEATLAELSRVIRPGGVLAVNFPNALSPYLPYAMGVKLTGTSLRKGVHTRWYTPGEVERILGAARFSVVETWGQIHYPWARGALVQRALARADAAVRHGRLSRLGSILFVLAQRA